MIVATDVLVGGRVLELGKLHETDIPSLESWLTAQRGRYGPAHADEVYVKKLDAILASLEAEDGR